MSLRASFFQLAMAIAVTLWPVLCCCGLNHFGCPAGAVGLDVPAQGHGDHHGNADGDDHQSGSSGGCHEDSTGGCHGDGSDGGCGCQKPSATLVTLEGLQLPLASQTLAVAWLPALGPGMISVHAVECWAPRVERPPPIPLLLRLRVLRI
jgi:hypothetical protein